MSVAYLGVGSNLGNRRANIKKAISILKNNPRVKIREISSLYETLPVGGPRQGPFLNCAIKIETSLSPRELLIFLKDTESQAGRRPSKVRWGPRVIDLDILLYGNKVVSQPDLKIPHPRLAERAFALKPLAEISPLTRHPVLKKRIKRIYENHKEHKKIN